MEKLAPEFKTAKSWPTNFLDASQNFSLKFKEDQPELIIDDHFKVFSTYLLSAPDSSF